MRYLRFLLCIILPSATFASVEFKHEFAPSEGLINRLEKPLRHEICLNGLWEFQGVDLPEGWQPGLGQAPELTPPHEEQWDDIKIRIPSPWNANDYKRSIGPDHGNFPSYPSSWDTYGMAWMRTTVEIPRDWGGMDIILHFEAVAGYSEVYVNGEKVVENFDLFLPFSADVSSHAQPGKSLEILIGVRKMALFDDTRTIGRRVIPGGSMWGQEAAGIWQDVYLHALPKVRIDDVYVKPLVSEGRLELDLMVLNNTDQPQAVTLGGTVSEWINLSGDTMLTAPLPKWELGDEVLEFPAIEAAIEAKGNQTVTLSMPITPGQLKLWSPDSPNLYGLLLSLDGDAASGDRKYQRFGWREWTIEGANHFLNGERIEMRGDSWHFQGIPQMTRRYAWAWYQLIKDANGNAVRPHAQIYPRFYMEMADEMGICVLSETGIWASDGGQKFDHPGFWEACRDQVRRLVLRDRNYASVFGWSVSNENQPVIAHVIRRMDLMPKQIEEWAHWVATCLELDPTRPWISGDGDNAGNGTLPVVIGHYGGADHMDNLAAHGKPWGIGEHSLAYHGTPPQIAQFNGSRAYESQEGRMEGLAIECYELIAEQRRRNAAFASVFNIVWYGLEPLALGLADTTRAPLPQDGIFFTAPYVEGKPGIQPERIGPYSTTLNPGYDPGLPLYIPWPMFDAIQAANAPGGPAPSPWSERPGPKEHGPKPESAAPYESVIFIGGEDSELKTQLQFAGVDFNDGIGNHAGTLAIIDGLNPPASETLASVSEFVQQGGDIWIWGASPDTVEAINQALPLPVEVTNRTATSLLVRSEEPIVHGLEHPDFYFSEIQRTPVMQHGLAGPFVEQGTVILEACDTDWTRWNHVEESIKTASIIRSEREAKASGAAMVQLQVEGGGQILINTFTQFTNTDLGQKVLRAMLENSGLPLLEAEIESAEGVFNEQAVLMRALALGALTAPTYEEVISKDFLEGETTARPEPGDPLGPLVWNAATATETGVFDFNTMRFNPAPQNAAAYLSFWLWSPRPLDNLLLEPDMPRLDLIAGSDDGCRIWLNGDLIVDDDTKRALNVGDIQVQALPLQQGWNHFLIKVVNGSGGWQFKAQLMCSDKEYLSKLKASLTNPDN